MTVGLAQRYSMVTLPKPVVSRQKGLKMKDGRIISKAASKASKKSYKTTAFKAFVDAAKAKSKDGKFHRVPKEGTKAYDKLLKQ